MNQEQEVLLFQLERVFATLGRNMLMIVEDLKQVHGNNFDKLYASLPPDLASLVEMADYFDEKQYEWIRKRVLDGVMSAKRDLKNSCQNR